MDRVDFDDFSHDYQSLLAEQLGFFEADSGYFAEYKARLARQLVGSEPSLILDFGCGVGRTVKFLQRYFPGSRVVGTDISEHSLAVARQENPGAAFWPWRDLPADLRFDLVFAANVFHHIAPGRRTGAMEFCARRLSAAGHLVVFEHNPYNPVTRYLVARCPFDRDAQLLTRRQVIGLARSAGLRVMRAAYTLFLPAALSKLRGLEPYLAGLPLGGQHVVHAVRS
jgi:SAM-dependent methyltransferase